MPEKKRTLTILYIADAAWVLFIFFRSLKSGAESTMESAWVLQIVRAVFPHASMHFIRKLAHFTEFFVLGCLLSSTFYLRRADDGRHLRVYAIACLLGLAAAACDELLQLTSPGRSCQITDVLLDFSGVLCAVLITALIHYLLEKRSR